MGVAQHLSRQGWDRGTPGDVLDLENFGGSEVWVPQGETTLFISYRHFMMLPLGKRLGGAGGAILLPHCCYLQGCLLAAKMGTVRSHE